LTLGTSTHKKITKERSMDLKRIATTVVATTLFASSTVAFAQSSSSEKALEKMTCEDFVGLEDSFKPDAVYWAIVYGEDGKPESAGVNVEGIEQIVPVVIEACQKAPKESFWQKVKAEFTKLRQKL
jgi:acid stress chaperone HdeA